MFFSPFTKWSCNFGDMNKTYVCHILTDPRRIGDSHGKQRKLLKKNKEIIIMYVCILKNTTPNKRLKADRAIILYQETMIV